jgi:hypothetical protein
VRSYDVFSRFGFVAQESGFLYAILSEAKDLKLGSGCLLLVAEAVALEMNDLSHQQPGTSNRFAVCDPSPRFAGSG